MHKKKHYYSFREQEKDEEILQIIRRHWFDILWQFIPILFSMFLIMTMMIVLPSYLSDVSSPLTILFVGEFLLLSLWMVVSIVWVDYYLDVWVITDRRVVNVEQKGLFMREVSELRYNKIQDITTEVHGIIPTVLHYGDVYVQTAGTQPRFLFHNVPYPDKIKEKLVKLQKHMRKHDLNEVQKIIHDKEEFQI